MLSCVCLLNVGGAALMLGLMAGRVFDHDGRIILMVDLFQPV